MSELTDIGLSGNRYRFKINELTKKYGESVPVGLFLGVKQANQIINKFYFDIAMGNLTTEQKLSALEFLAERIEERLDE